MTYPIPIYEKGIGCQCTRVPVISISCRIKTMLPPSSNAARTSTIVRALRLIRFIISNPYPFPYCSLMGQILVSHTSHIPFSRAWTKRRKKIVARACYAFFGPASGISGRERCQKETIDRLLGGGRQTASEALLTWVTSPKVHNTLLLRSHAIEVCSAPELRLAAGPLRTQLRNS